MDNPVLYSKAHSMQQRDNHAFLTKYWAHFVWSEQDDILDFGCGDGDSTRRLLADRIPRFNRLTGVDISKEMIDFAQLNNAIGNSRLDFRLLNIMDDAELDKMFPRTFDKIFSFYCIHWVRDQRKLMEAMYKVAKPGSQLLLLFAGYHPFATVWERMSQQKEWAEYMKDVRNFISIYHHEPKPGQMFADICRSVGFQIVEWDQFETDYTYESAQHANDALVAVSPFIKRIPGHLLDNYITDQLNEFKKEMTPVEDGTSAMTIRYCLTTAYLRRV